ncbi:HNH endonuclease domain-containing protein [Persephonella sp.]
MKIFLPYDRILDIPVFSSTLEEKYLTNSYKILWFYGILEEIKNKNKEIPIENIIIRMIAQAWYPILEYKLSFGKQDQLYILVNKIYKEKNDEIKNKYNLKNARAINRKYLLDFLFNMLKEKDQNLFEAINIISKYVPYRFLSPFYKNLLRGKKDYEKNDIIYNQLKNDPYAVYKIIKIKNKILKIDINEKWFFYFYFNQKIIESWVIYHLISFLQSKNPNIPAIVYKIFPPNSRKLEPAKDYWKDIVKISIKIRNPLKDIYTNNILSLEDISIDHFLPWNFVMHDQLWNLVPTFRNVNSSKSDNLPKKEKYLDKFIDFHIKSINIALKFELKNKKLEDYLYISDIYNNFDKNSFKENLRNTIEPLYQIALNQGYQEWEYKG